MGSVSFPSRDEKASTLRIFGTVSVSTTLIHGVIFIEENTRGRLPLHRLCRGVPGHHSVFLSPDRQFFAPILEVGKLLQDVAGRQTGDPAFSGRPCVRVMA